MGLSIAVYFIQNKSFAPEKLAAKMSGEGTGGESLFDAMIAYNKAAKWLPFFQMDICEGYTADIEDVKDLALRFEAPVLAMSVLDSDVLYLSYYEPETGEEYSYARPNDGEMEEYVEGYSTEFPAFLSKLCGSDEHSALEEIWENAEFAFTEDRMEKLCSALQAKPLYSADEIPEGYTAIYSE